MVMVNTDMEEHLVQVLRMVARDLQRIDLPPSQRIQGAVSRIESELLEDVSFPPGGKIAHYAITGIEQEMTDARLEWLDKERIPDATDRYNATATIANK